MYALGDLDELPKRKHDPLVEEIGEIMELRRRVLAGSDLQYMPPLARLLIEQEIPRLIGLLASARPAQPATSRG